MDTKKKATSSKNSPKVHVSKTKSLTKEIKPKAQLAAASSRSALMLSLAVKGKSLTTMQALADGKSRKHSNQKTHNKRSNQPPQLMSASSRRNLCAVKKHIALKEKSLINELEPGHMDYLPLDAVGSGSYGQCYRAHYREINNVVKKMIQRDTEEDKLRAKREVVHKEKSLLHLGTMKDCLGHIDYLPLDAVGSGSYGQCYRAHYRGLNSVVKKMIHRDIEEDK